MSSWSEMKMQSAMDVAWAGIAGFCGGVVYLILQKHVSSRLAVVVCVISVLFGIFVGGDLLATYLKIPPGGAGFLCGIASMQIAVWIANGSAFEWVRKQMEHRAKSKEEEKDRA